MQVKTVLDARFPFVVQGYTPLHIAALHGHRNILDLLKVTYGKSCFHLTSIASPLMRNDDNF